MLSLSFLEVDVEDVVEDEEEEEDDETFSGSSTSSIVDPRRRFFVVLSVVPFEAARPRFLAGGIVAVYFGNEGQNSKVLIFDIKN